MFTLIVQRMPMSAHSGSGISIRGTAYTKLQFYPPGWAKRFNGQGCDARDWCAALTIDSPSEDPPIRTPIGSPDPLQFNPATSGRRTSFPAVLPDLALPGRGAGRACGGSRGRAWAAAGGAGLAGSTDVPGTRCRPRGTAAGKVKIRSRGGLSARRCYRAGGGCWPVGRSPPV